MTSEEGGPLPESGDESRSTTHPTKGATRLVAELRGALERDKASMAGLIVMEPLGPSKADHFQRAMSAAGDLELYGTPYPRMQLLTEQEILDRKRFHTPGVVGRSAAQPTLPGTLF